MGRNEQTIKKTIEQKNIKTSGSGTIEFQS
jgi:hypothetical protein